ncbi:MupA/Atu3671 family FMN-dependent luciferase-like monooxygenase [Streptomyces sp. ISL-100]|uniref:MupA/Atu3671 family FMN-dependent luciferase-like monooxygenase n=1 Tax=Streptomyces sp. ISL-100 TaxID=2819173 RepID=UPI001BE9972B|nr:MupA/Atu3671 family FMN-dependent luciferase-like monooxygenase [Streptomyces sp. ISL-100]MBT2398637.1 LLM class flavin-dependent oxidoreductase [Streptomyces sp. ISL-100]
MSDEQSQTQSDETEVARKLKERLSSLSPEQRAVLERSMRERNVKAPSAVDSGAKAAAKSETPRRSRRPGSTMDFSLFFFSGDGTAKGPGKYQLLLDSARHADANGFDGIWVPERHFVDFGGLYPNPSLLASAIAVLTENIQIRAGSCVLPLHHPVRVAEEWAVVDNLSGGRAAISAASGWHPDDFLLAPGDGQQRYPRRKDEMFESIDAIQRLWAGESVEFPRADGSSQSVRTLPRPLQPKLPVWVSAQGSIETFVRAGETGAYVLTGLVAQRPADLRDKIAAYREALAKAGYDPAEGKVTAMVHTFVGSDNEEARETVRGPLTAYLKTFLEQQDSFGSEFSKLNEAERDVMLNATFERYFDTLALLGTPDKCESLIEDLVDIGVDEVACLVDFGLDPGQVLKGLDHLTELKNRYRHRGDTEGDQS